MFARSMVLAVGVLLVGAAPASAQDHRMSLTGFVGSAAYSGLAAGAADELILEPGVFAGAHAELFFGRFGLRLGGGYASPSLENDGATGLSLLTGDLDLVMRLRRPYPNTFFQPYALLGGGAVRYDLDSDAATIGAESWEEDPATRGSVVVGLGTDLGRGPVAVRIELTDIIALSSPVTAADGSRYGAVQHVVLTFGLGFRTGSLGLPPRPEPEPRPVAIAPSPRPRPSTPPRRPAPQTPPSTARPRPPVTQPTAPPPQTVPSGPEDRYPVVAPPVTDPSGPRPNPPVVAPPAPDPSGPRPQPPVVQPTPQPQPQPQPEPQPEPQPQPQPQPTPQPTPTPTPTPTPEPQPTPQPQPQPTPTPQPTPQPQPQPEPVVEDSSIVRGRLFTVRVAWNPTRPTEVQRAAALAAALEAAGVPALPATAAPGARRVTQRYGAWRNAADANAFGEYVAATYDLDWEWVHIGKDEPMTVAVVSASHAFVDALGAPASKPSPRGRSGN